MILTKEDIKVLVDFADEGDRPGGTTAWGPLFDNVMALARKVRGATRDETQEIEIEGEEQ